MKYKVHIYWIFDEEKGYCLLSNGKLIVGRDVILEEIERKIPEEIECLLENLEKHVDKEKK